VSAGFEGLNSALITPKDCGQWRGWGFAMKAVIGRVLDYALTGIGVTIQFCIFLAAIFVAVALEMVLTKATAYALLALIFFGGLGIFIFALTRERSEGQLDLRG
jgi:hypothetical protein